MSKAISAPLVSPSAGWTFYGSGTTHTNGVAAWSTAAPEIATLARNLGGGGRRSIAQFVQNVFDYTRNNIEVEFRFGLGKGGRGAVIDQSGTPFDQAELMVRVLRQGGVSASYQVGTITLTAQQFGQWTGLVTGLNPSSQTFTVDAHQACQFLADGGIPAVVNGASDCSTLSGNLTSVTMSHIWVSANGTLYDPSFKIHLLKSAIDVSAAMGCGTASSPTCGSTIVSAAAAGSTSGTDSGGSYVQNLNYPAMGTTLQSFGVSLQSWIQGHDRTALLQDIVGGPQLTVSVSAATSGTLSAVATWTGDIPDQYRTTLAVSSGTTATGATGFSNGAGISQTFFADELAGRRLQIVNGSPSQLFILDSAPVTSSPCTCGSTFVGLAVHHPYAANSGTYASDSIAVAMPGEAGYDSGTYPITIIHGWGTGSQSTDQHDAALQEANPYPISQAVRTINNADSNGGQIVQASYSNDNQGVLPGKLLGQAAGADRVIAGLGDAKITRHHDIGIAFARPYDPSSSSYISLSSAISVNTDSANTALRCPIFQIDALAWSMLEGAVNTQVENSLAGLTAASFVNLFNSEGKPLHGPVSCALNQDNMVNGVGGGGALFTDPLHAAIDTVKRDESAAGRKKYLSVSPADGGATLTVTDLVAGTGKFPESLPFQRTYRSNSGLSERVVGNTSQSEDGNDNLLGTSTAAAWRYSGPDSASNTHLGGGWTHNYDVTATYAADNYKAFGSENALSASQSIAALWSLLDAERNLASGPAYYNTIVLSSYWLATKLAFDSVVVDKGGQAETFHRLPDGSFNSTAGAAQLVQTGESHPSPATGAQDFTPVTLVYTGKDGDTINFDWARQSAHAYCCGFGAPVADPIFKANQWSFPDGTVVTFSYSPTWLITSWTHNVACSDSSNGGACVTLSPSDYPYGYTLTGVSNNRGRSLTFSLAATTVPVPTPDGGAIVNLNSSFRITAVTDQSGRSVSYALSDCPTPPGGTVARLVCNKFTATAPDGTVTAYTYNTESDGTGAMASTYRMNAWFPPSTPTVPYQSLAYDGLLHVTAVTDANGHVTSHYSGGISALEIWKRGDTADPLGNTTTSIFDPWNSELAAIDPLGRTKTFAYDNAHRKILETNPEGDSAVFAYDVRSNLLSTTRHAKPGSGLSDIVTSATFVEAANVQTCSNYVTCNKPATETSGIGTVTSHSWNSTTGLQTSIVTGLNAGGTCLITGGSCPQVDFTYTAYSTSTGSLYLLTSTAQKIDASHSLTTNYSYNASNAYVLASETVDPSGLNLTTSVSFDAVGNLTQVDGPRTDVSDVTDYTWDVVRRPKMTIKAGTTDNGVTHPRIASKFTYDLDGQLVQTDQGTTTNATGSDFSSLLTVTTAYDPVGNKIRETTPTSLTQYTYDAADRLLCTAVRMNPAAFGTLPASACSLGAQGSSGPDRISENVYDAAGQLRQIARGLGTMAEQVYATYKYSDNGKQIAVADADGVPLIGLSYADALNAAAATAHQTNFVYDGFDRLKQTVYADSTSDQATSYDNDGNVLAKLTRAGQALTFSYDALDRMHTKVVPAVSGVSAAATVTWAYDAMNRIVSLSDTLSNTIAYGYDLAGRQTSVATTTPGLGSKTVSYQVDAAGNRTRITWPDAYYVTYGFDALDRMASASENGSVALAAYDYDSLGRRASVQFAGSGASTAYTWSPEGDLTALAHNFPAAGTDNVGYTDAYTPAHQVASSAISNTLFQYVPPGGAPPSYAVNGLNQYTSVAGTTYGYDANGNLTGDGTFSFGYDPENRLMVANKTGVASTYAYDPLGRRTAKSVATGGGPLWGAVNWGSFNWSSGTTVTTVATAFLYADDNEIAEYDGASGALLRRFVPGAAVDEDIAMVTAAGVKSFFHPDKTSSTVAMSTAAGAVAEGPYTYDAYGVSASTSGVPFRYTGQYYDAETGLYYYRARYYAPSIGRFLQTDPVGYKDDVNWYAYVGNDPANRTDPTGMAADMDLGYGPNPYATAEGREAGAIIVGGGVVATGAVMYDAPAALAGGTIAMAGYAGGQYVTGEPITVSGSANAFVTGEVGAITSAKTAVQATVAMGGNIVQQLGETGQVHPGQVALAGASAVIAEKVLPGAVVNRLPGGVQAGANLLKNFLGTVVQNVVPKLPTAALKVINSLQRGNPEPKVTCTITGPSGHCSGG